MFTLSDSSQFANFEFQKSNNQFYNNTNNNTKPWRGYAEDGPRRFYGVVGSLDDKKYQKRSSSFWIKCFLFSCMSIAVALGVYWLHSLIELRHASRRLITLYLNNGCKGESILITAASGVELIRKDGQKTRAVSFCDLKFHSAGADLPANDQARRPTKISS